MGYYYLSRQRDQLVWSVMELFSIRRLKLKSAQLYIKVGHCPSCTVSVVLEFLKQLAVALPGSDIKGRSRAVAE